MRISSVVFAISLILWWQILSKLEFSKSFRISAILTMLILETFFSMANQSRTDSFTFFLITLGLLLFICRAYLVSGFILILAVETHFIGLTGFFYCLAYVIAYPQKVRENLVRSILLLGIGVAAGVALYFYLHLDAFVGGFTSTIAQNTGGGGVATRRVAYVMEYFFETKYYRHIPELLILIATTLLFVKNKMYKEPNGKFLLIFPLSIIVSMLLLRRGNFHYTPFIFVSFVFIMVAVAEKYRRIWLLNLLWLALLLPQYGFVYYKQHNYPGTMAYLDLIRQEVPQDGTPIFGDSRIFYAFVGIDKVHDIRRIKSVYDDLDAYNYSEFYLTGYDMDSGRTTHDVVADIATTYDCTPISEAKFYNQPIVTWKCIKK